MADREKFATVGRMVAREWPEAVTAIGNGLWMSRMFPDHPIVPALVGGVVSYAVNMGADFVEGGQSSQVARLARGISRTTGVLYVADSLPLVGGHVFSQHGLTDHLTHGETAVAVGELAAGTVVAAGREWFPGLRSRMREIARISRGEG